MASPIKATIILCDAAQADPSGKLHMLGAGWSVTGSPTGAAAVAVLLKIPWDLANTKLPFSLQLEDADGQPVILGGGAVDMRSEFEVGRPPGLDPGSPIDASFQLSVQPMPLAPGRYQWRLQVGDDEFAESFQVRG
ncbi:MAG TPA: hypothetical protein VHX15_17515 [Frankiaceae bacterium]|nr:hypothetical protein [Frankiaceae bacterium]